MTRQLAGGEILGVAAESRAGDQSSGIGETGTHRIGRAMAILVASLPTLLSTQTTQSPHHRGGEGVAGVVRTGGENQEGVRTGTAVLGMGTVGATAGVKGDTRTIRVVIINKF